MEYALTSEMLHSSPPLVEMNSRELISTLSRILPTQGAITEFIHHNTLHAFQSLPFSEAVIEAGKLYGANVDPLGIIPHAEGISANGIRVSRAKKIGLDIDERLMSFMIRIGAAFFDQGLAPATLPHRKDGIWNAIRQLSRDSIIPIPELTSKQSKSLLTRPANEAVEDLLNGLLGDRKLRPRYVAEVLLHLKGWAGLCHVIETGQYQIEHGSSAKLEEWVALYLLVEWNLLSKMFDPLEFQVSSFERSASEETPYDARKLQEDLFTLEQRTYLPILQRLAQTNRPSSSGRAKAQAIFCIDDREFSMRRYIENLGTGVQTYGAAGFFGLDIQLLEPHKTHATKLCPPAVQPNFSVSMIEPKPKHSFFHDLFWSSGSSSIWSGWFITQLVGIPSGIQFLMRILFPTLFGQRKLEDDLWKSAPIKAFQSEFEPVSDLVKPKGLSIEEAAERVKNLLDTIGFPNEYAPIVAIVGHGASSTNNPYFAAYDCGACSGRPGALNARTFAKFANAPEVREKMAILGRAIPANTLFVPILHDTTVDVFDVLDRRRMTHEQEDTLRSLELDLAKAAGQNAVHRCRQFQRAKRNLTPSEALKHVFVRASAWFEARPEYNHATNVAAIIGPNFLYRNLDVDMNIFLHSYEPDLDTSGNTIGRILSAVIPVCGGINLEYFFSTLDGQVYGAGNKLPQNIVGNVGVMSGFESDFRTGLPNQMTEIHEPRRLLVYVFQNPEIVLQALLRMPFIFEWVENGWIHLIAQDPISPSQFRFVDGQWSELDSSTAKGA